MSSLLFAQAMNIYGDVVTAEMGQAGLRVAELAFPVKEAQQSGPTKLSIRWWWMESCCEILLCRDLFPANREKYREIREFCPRACTARSSMTLNITQVPPLILIS